MLPCVFFDEADPSCFGLGEAAVVFRPVAGSRRQVFLPKLMELQANVRLGIPTDLRRFPSLQFPVFGTGHTGFLGRGTTHILQLGLPAPERRAWKSTDSYGWEITIR